MSQAHTGAVSNKTTLGSPLPKVLIPVALGTNRDQDLKQAFDQAGANAHTVPIEALKANEVKLRDYQILALAGGFSHGDALGAGRLLGLDLLTWFSDQLREANAREMPMIGICNGFQTLVRAGLLPGNEDAVLTQNESARFECRWVTLSVEAANDSVWLSEVTEPLRCPVAHMEGRFLTNHIDRLENRSGVAFRYGIAHDSIAADSGAADSGAADSFVPGVRPRTELAPADGLYPNNPNGSQADIAGVTDPTGAILGMMPHPENNIFARQDPLRGRKVSGDTLSLFRSAVSAVGGGS